MPASPRFPVKYRRPEAAAAYARKFSGSWTRRLSHRRELALVARALAAAGPARRLLDCPCGAGRLLPLLLRSAPRVTEADLAREMIRHAREAAARAGASGRAELTVASIHDLPFPDRCFDVAVCHRLLHHLAAPERAAALRELARVTRNAVVLSFWDAGTARARRLRRRAKPPRRTMLNTVELQTEAGAFGLRLEHPVWHVSSWTSPLAVALLRVERAGA